MRQYGFRQLIHSSLHEYQHAVYASIGRMGRKILPVTVTGLPLPADAHAQMRIDIQTYTRATDTCIHTCIHMSCAHARKYTG